MEMKMKTLAEQFLALGNPLLPFAPVPNASNREYYDGLEKKLRDRLISRGEAFLHYTYPAIHATDFMAFKRTGNRVDYEAIYFERRHALNALVIAECLEYKGRFLDDIINGIFVLCEESAWQLPPHNSYERGKPQELLPDSLRSVLDLFACETGSQLACIFYLLREALDKISPFITKRILHEVTIRILRPYLTQHFWWMGNGDEPMCNWTPWCTQNVLLCAFLTETEENTRKAILLKASESLDYFLKDYGEDGCCDEGAQYFRRAGLCLDASVDLLNQVTNHFYDSVYTWDKIKNIASYIEHVHIEDKYYFNFADCSPIAGRCGVREYLFGKRTANASLMLFAAKDVQTGEEEILSEEIFMLNLYYQSLHLFYHKEVMCYPAKQPVLHREIYYSSIGLFLSREEDFQLAVKAGDNADNHNHNDTGSLTLFSKGQPILVDIGVESYTAKTFSSKRYEIWTMQSCYHNLPTIAGTDQSDGSAFFARNVKTDFTSSASSISMELQSAYPLSDPDCIYEREVILQKNTHTVLLKDRTNCKDVILNFITYFQPVCEPDGQQITIGPVTAAFSGASVQTIETLPITDKRLQTAWDHDLYRVRLVLTAAEFEMRFQRNFSS